MKSLNLVFKQLHIPLLFIKHTLFSKRKKESSFTFYLTTLLFIILSPLQLHAAVDTCPGNTLANLNGTSSNANQTVTTTVPANTVYYYTFTPSVSGKIQVDSTANKSSNSLYIVDGCSTTLWSDTANSTTKSSPSINVTANQQIVISFYRRYSTSINVDLDFTFTITPPKENCPGVVIPNLDGTSVTATDTFANETIDYGQSYFYYFTPTVNGEFRIDFNSDYNNRDVSVRIYDGCGTLLVGDEGSGDRVVISNVVANRQIIAEVYRRYNSSMDYDIDFTFTKANNPPTFTSSPPTSVNDNVNYTYTPTTNDLDGDSVTVTATTLPSWLTFDGTTLSGVPGAANAGNHTVTLQANDGNGGITTQTFVITVNLVSNVAPTFTSTPITTSNINLAYSYAVTTHDDNGDTVTVTARTLPAWASSFNGTVLSGTPTITGTYNVTLLADDGHGATATQTFSITVSDQTDFQEGLQDFALINPQSTRNILGNFATLGNTIECITNKRGTSSESNPYNGTCQNSTAYNDNNYMAKYIDIDGNSGIGARTWNSSSSNFTLPDTYNQDNGKGILWAGLFWQGSINNKDSYKQRRAYVDGGSYSYKYITSNQSIDLEATDGNKVLMKIDNNGTYNPIKAHNFYYDKHHGSYGGYYAAFADVTAYLQNANLAGDTTHTITLANITANEGRESGTGNYAGWSMIVIYKESSLPGVKARNISIYNGYTTIKSGAGRRSVNISGFKLPSTGTVNAQFSAFAGEGEWIYGHATDKYDRMIISSDPNFAAGVTHGMPGAADPDNIFDAILANIDRTPGNNNEMTGNNNGIDIENYDVTSIMSGYRDTNPDIKDVYIGLSSNNDYVTPSMMAFSAELYKPKVCYDYTVQLNNFDITQDNRTIETRGGGGLSVNIALESLEGDFNLENAQIGVNLSPASTFNKAFYAPNNVNTFIPAIYIDDNTSKPLIALGENISNQGGTIRIGQRYFSKFLFDLHSAYTGKFEVSLISTIDYGSGPVPSVQSTQYNEIPRCPQSLTYNAQPTYFNVERRDSGNYDPVTRPKQRFPLYTQVVGKDFNVSLVAYDANATPAFSREIALSGYTVDIELINAKPFNDDKAIFICNNPDPSIIKEIMPGITHKFVTLGSAGDANHPAFSQERVDLNESIQTDTALRNAAFRMWYLVDENNTIIPHECAENDETCFKDIYDKYIKASDTTLQADGTHGFCGDTSRTKACTSGSGCYQCLRDYHAKAACSRDNFSIRPASYRVKISDNAQSTDASSTESELGQNDPRSSVANLAAGYRYKLDAMATSYRSDTVPALGYTRDFAIPKSTDLISRLTYDVSKNGTGCVDTNDTDWEVHFENGTLDGTSTAPEDLNHLVIHSNVGEYNYHLEDNNWTIVDQRRYPYKTFPGVDDCAVGNIIIGGIGKSGCTTDSNITVKDKTYTDLALTYRPYKFDLSSVNYVKHPNDGRTFIYLNDFDNTYYSDLLANPVDMAISFEGNVSALGADDTLLTNFTNTCAANDVTLSLNRTTNPIETSLRDTAGQSIELQQYLQIKNRYSAFVDQQIGTDVNITLPKRAFEDTVNSGKATMFLHTTFKKPLNALVDPFKIQYNDLNATGGTALQSSTDLTTHIPEGNNTYDQNITYMFAKVTPLKELYENVTKDYQQTPIFVDIYCSLGADCNDSFNLDTITKGEDQLEKDKWYYATLFDNTVDGTTDLVATTDPGSIPASPSVTPNNDVPFDSDVAEQSDINVTVAGSGRTSIVNVQIRPVPWLLYDLANVNGFPNYKVEFIDNTGWSGVGNTGSVGGLPSSKETADRMIW